MSFPDFMFREENRIPSAQQNTPDIEGYYYTANDGSQMAFWIYKADRVSTEHSHEYDEYIALEIRLIMIFRRRKTFLTKDCR